MKCTTCQADIGFVEMESGKKMPVNLPAVSVTHPPETLIQVDLKTQVGTVIKYRVCDGMDNDKFNYYRPHWASCKQADSHRRSKK